WTSRISRIKNVIFPIITCKSRFCIKCCPLPTTIKRGISNNIKHQKNLINSKYQHKIRQNRQGKGSCPECCFISPVYNCLPSSFTFNKEEGYIKSKRKNCITKLFKKIHYFIFIFCHSKLLIQSFAHKTILKVNKTNLLKLIPQTINEVNKTVTIRKANSTYHQFRTALAAEKTKSSSRTIAQLLPC